MRRAALVIFLLALVLCGLELTLRATGWIFLQMRQTEGTTIKQGRHYRILCVGESTTADMLFLGKESYPAQLERILNERATEGVSFTVINGGVPATTTNVILAELPKNLEQHHPDIVVTMMGINDDLTGVNDKGFINSISQVSDNLRVWRVAKVIYYAWLNPHALMENADPAAKGSDNSTMLLLRFKTAWDGVIEGHYAEAEALMKPMLNYEKWPIVKSRAHGIMAVLNWQRGDERKAENYHQRFLELESLIPRSKTVHNYRELQRILREHKIPLVAVQYPALPIGPLRQMIEPAPGMVFVDNEQTFLQAIKTQPVGKVFRDLFGGIFGHMTPYGNDLLAENVARGVLELVPNSRVEYAMPVRRQ